MKKLLLLVVGLVAVTAFATPVEVDWKAGETAPAKVARPFAGFLPDGRFVVAGGSDFVDGKKVYRSGIYARELDGKWSKVGELPHPIAEGVCCETPFGLFCAGGTDGETVFTNTFEIIVNKFAEHGLDVVRGLRLPKPVKMGAAAYHDGLFFVIASKDVYGISLKRGASRFVKIGEMPGPAREQIVAAVQNGDQKEKMLIVAGGYDKETKKPLRDVYGLVLSSVRMPWSESKEGNPKLRLDDVYDDPDFISHPAQMKWKKLADLPEGVTTIGAAFLPSGHQHILLVGGFGEKGWIDRAVNGSTETDPVKLGWQRKIYAYNCVTDAWCEYGEIAPDDSLRGGRGHQARQDAGGIHDHHRGRRSRAHEAHGRRVDSELQEDRQVRRDGMGGRRSVCPFDGGDGGVLHPQEEGRERLLPRRKPHPVVCRRNVHLRDDALLHHLHRHPHAGVPPGLALLRDGVLHHRHGTCRDLLLPAVLLPYLPFFCRLGITSAYEYLEKRFNLGVRLFGSAAFVVFMVCRVAVVTLLPAIALNAVTGISIDACILICGILTMIYCSLGGLEAVIWSDFVQGIVLMGGAVSVLVLLILKTGPDGAHFSTFWNVATSCEKTRMWDFRLLFSQPVFWVVAVQGLISNLSSYTSDQCVIQRYIATPDENATKRSLWFNGCMSVFAQVVFYGIGTALFAFYHTNPAAMDVTMPKGDSVLPIFMATEMPPWLAGLVIAAVFAATISTLSANLSSASTAVVTDFIKRFKPNIPGKAQIRCGQVCTYVVGVVGIMAALTLARMESSALFDNFNKYIAMLTAGLTGLFFMGVFIPRIKGVAAVLGLTANYFVCFSCEILHCDVFGLKFHPFLLGGIGLVVCVAVAYIASFLLREKGHDLAGLTLKTLKKPSGSVR